MSMATVWLTVCGSPLWNLSDDAVLCVDAVTQHFTCEVYEHKLV